MLDDEVLNGSRAKGAGIRPRHTSINVLDGRKSVCHDGQFSRRDGGEDRGNVRISDYQ